MFDGWYCVYYVCFKDFGDVFDVGCCVVLFVVDVGMSMCIGVVLCYVFVLLCCEVVGMCVVVLMIGDGEVVDIDVFDLCYFVEDVCYVVC